METLDQEKPRSSSERNAAEALVLLKRFSGASDNDIAKFLGLSRIAVIHRRSGHTPIPLADIDGLAEAIEDDEPTGSEMEPGAYIDGGIWVAWDFHPADNSDTITVTA